MAAVEHDRLKTKCDIFSSQSSCHLVKNICHLLRCTMQRLRAPALARREKAFPLYHVLACFQDSQRWKGNPFLSPMLAGSILSRRFPHIKWIELKEKRSLTWTLSLVCLDYNPWCVCVCVRERERERERENPLQASLAGEACQCAGKSYFFTAAMLAIHLVMVSTIILFCCKEKAHGKSLALYSCPVCDNAMAWQPLTLQLFIPR
jgi:hypothetical protein